MKMKVINVKQPNWFLINVPCKCLSGNSTKFSVNIFIGENSEGQVDDIQVHSNKPSPN